MQAGPGLPDIARRIASWMISSGLVGVFDGAALTDGAGASLLLDELDAAAPDPALGDTGRWPPGKITGEFSTSCAHGAGDVSGPDSINDAGPLAVIQDAIPRPSRRTSWCSATTDLPTTSVNMCTKFGSGDSGTWC